MTTYQQFLDSKRLRNLEAGFKPTFMPDCLFEFQKHLTEWAVRRGRAALFESCGLGKTPQQLVWAENVVRKTNGRVLILTPLAVSQQTVREAEKFGMKANRTQDGKLYKGINVTNYERLNRFDPKDFVGLVLDESGILKGFDRKFRRAVTDFMTGINYRLLCTATPAPNDYMELGSSAEALGVMTRNQMLSMFFTNGGKTTQQWELKGHAKKRFWQWMATWSRAIQKPSDLGYPDDGFILPELKIETIVLRSENDGTGTFDPEPARTLNDQRRERRRTLQERCEKVAELIPKKGPCLIWCQLNSESELLTKLIPDAVQVQGSDLMEVKEERLSGFVTGEVRVLVTKSKIAGFGLNLQHCSEVFYFPSWSWESYYQSIRRCWRFGQKKPVTCRIVTTEKERFVLEGMLKKDRQSQEFYAGICREMGKVIDKKDQEAGIMMKIPSWMKNGKG